MLGIVTKIVHLFSKTVTENEWLEHQTFKPGGFESESRTGLFVTKMLSVTNSCAKSCQLHADNGLVLTPDSHFIFEKS